MTSSSGYHDLPPTGPLPDPAGRRDWRPAVYAERLHLLAAAPELAFGGQPIARTACGQTAYTDTAVRGGQNVWQRWPCCQACQYPGSAAP